MTRFPRSARGAYGVALALALGLSQPGLARPPEGWQEISREIRIFEDVFGAAIRNADDSNLRIGSAKAHYYANQGIVVELDVSSPWPGHRAKRAIQIDTSLNSLSEVPAMVHDILADLEIAIAPYEPEELQELQELRGEQRDLTTEARRLRSDLRELRRRLSREDDADERSELADEIAELERELDLTAQEEAAIRDDISAQYDRLKDASKRRADEPVQENAAELDSVVGRAACDYGATMKSLPDREHLSISVTQRHARRYYVFQMEDVRDCRDGKLDVDELLETGFVYSGN